MLRRGDERRVTKNAPPDEKHEHGQAEDGVGVAATKFVGKALRRGLEVLGLLDEPDDLLQRALAGGPQDDGLDRAPEIDGAGEQRVPNLLLYGGSFAGEVGFVRRRRAGDHFGIDRELVAGLDEQAHPRREFLDGHNALGVAGVQHGGGLGGGFEERGNFPLRTAHRVMLQRAGQRKQKQQRRTLAPRTHAGATHGDGEHEEMNVELAFLQAFPDLLRGEPGTAEIRREEQRQRPRATEQRGRQPKRAAENGREELLLPFLDVRLGVMDVDLTRHEPGPRYGPPPPEARCSRAGDASDGGAHLIVLDGQATFFPDLVGEGTVIAIRIAGEQTAARLVGLEGTNLIRDHALQVRIRLTQRGEGNRAVRAVELHRLERRLAPHHVRHRAHEAVGVLFGWGGRCGRS